MKQHTKTMSRQYTDDRRGWANMPYARSAAPASREQDLRDPAYTEPWQSWTYYPPQVAQRDSQRDAWEAMRTGDGHAWKPAGRDSASAPGPDRLDTRPEYRDLRYQDHQRYDDRRTGPRGAPMPGHGERHGHQGPRQSSPEPGRHRNDGSGNDVPWAPAPDVRDRVWILEPDLRQTSFAPGPRGSDPSHADRNQRGPSVARRDTNTRHDREAQHSRPCNGLAPAPVGGKRGRDHDDDQGRHTSKRQRTDATRAPNGREPGYLSEEAKKAFIRLLGDSNPFDELAPVSRSVRREWNALDTAYQKCSSLLLKGIAPDSYAISGISSKLAQYLSAVRRQRLAIGRG